MDFVLCFQALRSHVNKMTALVDSAEKTRERQQAVAIAKMEADLDALKEKQAADAHQREHGGETRRTTADAAAAGAARGSQPCIPALVIPGVVEDGSVPRSEWSRRGTGDEAKRLPAAMGALDSVPEMTAVAGGGGGHVGGSSAAAAAVAGTGTQMCVACVAKGSPSALKFSLDCPYKLCRWHCAQLSVAHSAIDNNGAARDSWNWNYEAVVPRASFEACPCKMHDPSKYPAEVAIASPPPKPAGKK